jgi:hypothetical protein
MGHIFVKGDDAAFLDYIGQRVDTSAEELVAKEAERLSPIFEAASAILPRCGRNHLNTPEDLKRLFKNSAEACASFMLNEPVLLQEGFGYAGDAYWDRSSTEELQYAYKERPSAQRNFSASFLNINGQYANKRMFKTGRFGFISVARTKEEAPRSAFVIPMVTLPPEISDLLKQERHKDLLDAFCELNYLTNHDWLHSIFGDAINTQITKLSMFSPITKSSRRVHYKMWRGSAQSTIATPMTKMATDWFEAFQMRFHAEALTHMASQPDNALERAVDNYMKAWKKFKKQTVSEGYMSDPAFTTPARFALRMLAFNLVRAVPLEHPIVQNILNDKDVGHDRIVIDKMYQALMTGIIFGNGKSKKKRLAPIPQKTIDEHQYRKIDMTLTTRKYSLSVKHTVSRGLRAADEDAIEALGLEKARPRIVRPSRAHRLKQAL